MQGIKELLPGVKYRTHFVLPDEQRGMVPVSFGNFFYVDSGSGDDSANTGTRPDDALATIDAAVGKCAANSGDIIYVLPGHAENISAATSLVADVAGIRIIGLGSGRARPVLTWTATAGTIELDAANVSLENLVFVSSVSAVATGINVDAADCSIINCEFNYDATGDDFVQMLDIDAVSRTRVIGNKVVAEETAGADQFVRLDTAHQTEIVGNNVTGDYTDAAIISEGALSNGLLISNNYIYNSDSTAGATIDLDVADTGVVSFNQMGTAYIGTAADSAVFDPGSCVSIENYLARGTDNPAYLVPAGSVEGRELRWRISKHASSVFDGGTLNAHGDIDGTDNPYTVFTVTGDVVLRGIWGVVNTTVAGATGTLELGTASNTAKLIAQSTGTNLADGDIWTDTGAEANVDVDALSGALAFINDGADIIETAGTADLTGGQIDYYAVWAPAEDGAYLAG